MPITINQCATCKSDPKIKADKSGNVFLACSNEGCYIGKKISAYNHDNAVALWNELNPTDAEILIPKPRENYDIRALGLVALIGIVAMMYFKVPELVLLLGIIGMYVVMCWSAHRHDMREEYPRTVKTYDAGYDHFDPYP